MGPSPAREGRPIGSAGPTTATRMDKYAPTLLYQIQKHCIENTRLGIPIFTISESLHGAVQGGLLPLFSGLRFFFRLLLLPFRLSNRVKLSCSTKSTGF